MVSLSCPSYWSIAISNLMAKKASIVPGTESPLSCRDITNGDGAEK